MPKLYILIFALFGVVGSVSANTLECSVYSTSKSNVCGSFSVDLSAGAALKQAAKLPKDCVGLAFEASMTGDSFGLRLNKKETILTSIAFPVSEIPSAFEMRVAEIGGLATGLIVPNRVLCRIQQ